MIPDFALAHAGLADVYVVLGDYRDLLPAEAYGRAREAADTALRLDPSLAEAHTTRAWLALSLERDWTSAEQMFQHALQLNPGYATAHQWHGEFLAALGRFDEAFAAMQRARDLDPLAPMPQAIHGWLAHLAGRHEEAIALCEAVLAARSHFPAGTDVPRLELHGQNRLAEAEREVASAAEDHLEPRGATRHTRADPGAPRRSTGRASRARRAPGAALSAIVRHCQALLRAAATRRHAEWLRTAEAERSSAVLYVKVGPVVWLAARRPAIRRSAEAAQPSVITAAAPPLSPPM